MYTYVSIAVVVLTTSVLHIVFRKKNLNDFRYYFGLGISAVIAIIASLFFPNMVSVTSVNFGLQLAIAFFTVFLIYIALLFLILILVSSIFSQKVIDKLKKKWIGKKTELKMAKEQKIKKKEEIKTKVEEEHAYMQENIEVQSEPVLKNIFINKFSPAEKENAGEVDMKTREDNNSEVPKSGNIFGEAAATLEVSAETAQNFEKNVDTPDIIDKMGIDMISSTMDSDLHFSDMSVESMLEKAFLLMQEGREFEAVSVFMDALDKKPDNEVVFWIVVDICVIYKNAGQTELAQDILKTYIDEYESIMSNDVKELILQNL